MKHRPLYQPRSSAAPGTGANEAVRLRAVSKVYRSRGGPVAALRELTLAFVAGSFTAAMGPYGSGQEHLAAVRRRAGPAHLGGDPGGRA